MSVRAPGDTESKAPLFLASEAMESTYIPNVVSELEGPWLVSSEDGSWTTPDEATLFALNLLDPSFRVQPQNGPVSAYDQRERSVLIGRGTFFTPIWAFQERLHAVRWKTPEASAAPSAESDGSSGRSSDGSSGRSSGRSSDGSGGSDGNGGGSCVSVWWHEMGEGRWKWLDATPMSIGGLERQLNYVLLRHASVHHRRQRPALAPVYELAGLTPIRVACRERHFVAMPKLQPMMPETPGPHVRPPSVPFATGAMKDDDGGLLNAARVAITEESQRPYLGSEVRLTMPGGRQVRARVGYPPCPVGHWTEEDFDDDIPRPSTGPQPSSAVDDQEHTAALDRHAKRPHVKTAKGGSWGTKRPTSATSARSQSPAAGSSSSKAASPKRRRASNQGH